MLITRLWRKQPGKFFCISTKSGRGKWEDHFFSRKELDDIPDFIEDSPDKNIYFCPHGFNKPRRIKENAVLPSMLWSDLDEVNPRKTKFKPTVAIESSPGRYVGLWVTNKSVTEELNRRMVYAAGADRSGWDLTQVLRVPNTTNYKYEAHPKVKTLWSDGPEYTIEELERKLGKVKPISTEESADTLKIYSKYEKKLPMWLRRELMNGKPTVGKRSDMLWKMEQHLIEAGMSTDEVVVLIKQSKWNKFKGRRNEDDQIRHEVEKVINGHFHKVPEEEEELNGVDLLFRSMDKVEEENIDWIYYPYLARGQLTIVEGDPGLGKSYLMEIISSHICDGRQLPSVRPRRTVQGKVLYFDMENSAGSVTKKRLVWNGTKHLENFIQCEDAFSVQDSSALDQVYDYAERERPALIVFDTLNTYLGAADVFKGSEAQQAFMNFRRLASHFNCSVVVLRHLTKSPKDRALYRGQGNIAFAGVARVIMTVGVMPDDPETRVIAVAKLNITRSPKALTFKIEKIPDTLKDQDRSKFVWGEFVDMTADDILVAPRKDDKKLKEREDAIKFVEDVLDDKPLEETRLERMAEARSIGKKALYAALKELKAEKGIKDRWSLP